MKESTPEFDVICNVESPKDLVIELDPSDVGSWQRHVATVRFRRPPFRLTKHTDWPRPKCDRRLGPSC